MTLWRPEVARLWRRAPQIEGAACFLVSRGCSGREGLPRSGVMARGGDAVRHGRFRGT